MRMRLGVVAVLSLVALSSTYAQARTLFELVKTGTPQEIQAAIKSGASVNARDNDGVTPLMHAAAWNINPQVISTLLKAGADPNERDKYRTTPLMLAAG